LSTKSFASKNQTAADFSSSLESVTSGEVTFGEAPQGTGSDWKNLPGTPHIDRQTDTIALIYKIILIT
jgi:hypothetical protein